MSPEKWFERIVNAQITILTHVFLPPAHTHFWLRPSEARPRWVFRVFRGSFPDLRRGLLLIATDDDGEIDDDELFEQIRVTILHEVAHHRGMNEGEVDELGYG